MRAKLLLATFVWAALSWAQTKHSEYPSKKDASEVKPIESTVLSNVKNAKTQLIWSEDFAGERWSATVTEWGYGYRHDPSTEVPGDQNGNGQWAVVDDLDFNYYWHWSDVGPRGAYTSWEDDDCHTPDAEILTRMPEEASIDNGFMIMEADYFNTTEDCDLNPGYLEHSSSLIFGPIDFSDYSAVVINLKTYYRFCCTVGDGFYLDFSTDYDMESGEGSWEGDIQINETNALADYTYVENRDYSYNVSSFVGNQSNVYFKLRISGASHYFILLDDIAFYEPDEYDLLAEDNWAYYLYDADDPDYTIFDDPKYNFYGAYTAIPNEIVAPFVKFKSAVVNNGIEEVSNARVIAEVYKNGTLIETFEGTGKTIAPGIRDTLVVETSYTPDEMASYKIVLNSAIDEADGNTENNLWEYDFEVSSTTYSRVYHGAEESYGTHSPRNFADGGYDGDAMMQPFNIPEGESVTLEGIRVYIDDYTDMDEDIAAIEAGEFGMVAKVWQDGEEFVDLGISSDYYILEISDTASWIYLEFVNGNLTLEGDENEYLVGIEVYTGTNTNVEEPERYFQIGTDLTIKQPVYNGGVCFLIGVSSLAYNSPNYAIELVLEGDGPEEVNVTFNFDLNCLEGLDDGTNTWFNPAEDVLYVTGSFSEWSGPGVEGSLAMTDEDGDKIYTATAYGVAANSVLEYKYFSGEGWDNGEWTGDPNRMANVYDFNFTISDEPMRCSLSDKADALDRIEIYPNPFEDEISLNGTEHIEKVIIRTILGKTVQTIPGVQAETIATSELNQGVYLLTIIDTNKASKTYKIVKK